MVDQLHSHKTNGTSGSFKTKSREGRVQRMRHKVGLIYHPYDTTSGIKRNDL